MTPLATATTVRVVGRYAIHEELAAGGMASVHLGRLLGEVGFARTVAIKMLHTQYARDPEFVAMFLDEARLVSRIKHPNVVPTLDIVSLDGELFLVMEYVHGEPLSRVMMALSRRKERMPVNIAVGICLGLLEGLHAAHEAKSEEGEAMGIVHRDVSPQNVMVGADGITRVLDFGIAKAAKRIQTTEDGQFKGKLGYMPPDVLTGGKVDRRADVWGAAVVLWEMLVGKRLFVSEESPFALVKVIVDSEVDPPSMRKVEGATPELDAVVLRGLAKKPDDRFATAREMAIALEKAVPPASPRAVSEWLQSIAAEALAQRAARVEAVEVASRPEMMSVGAVHSLTGGAAGAARKPGTITGPLSPIVNHDATVVMPSSAPSSPRNNFNTGMTGNTGIGIGPGQQPISELSAISYGSVPPTHPYPQRPPQSKLVQSILALVVFVVLIVPIGIFALRQVLPSSKNPPPITTTAPPVESTIAAADSVPAMAAVASAAPSTSASASAAVAVPAPSASSHARVVTTRTGTAAPPTASPKCNPPYTIGPPPDFIRKPKLECLNH